MPNYNDLAFLKSKIQSLGNEIEILQEKNLPFNDTELPEEIESEEIEDQISNDDDLLTDILSDLNEGYSIDNEEPPAAAETGGEEGSPDEAMAALLAPGGADEPPLESIDDFLSDLNAADTTTTPEPAAPGMEEMPGLDDLMTADTGAPAEPGLEDLLGTAEPTATGAEEMPGLDDLLSAGEPTAAGTEEMPGLEDLLSDGEPTAAGTEEMPGLEDLLSTGEPTAAGTEEMPGLEDLLSDGEPTAAGTEEMPGLEDLLSTGEPTAAGTEEMPGLDDLLSAGEPTAAGTEEMPGLDDLLGAGEPTAAGTEEMPGLEDLMPDLTTPSEEGGTQPGLGDILDTEEDTAEIESLLGDLTDLAPPPTDIPSTDDVYEQEPQLEGIESLLDTMAGGEEIPDVSAAGAIEEEPATEGLDELLGDISEAADEIGEAEPISMDEHADDLQNLLQDISSEAEGTPRKEPETLTFENLDDILNQDIPDIIDDDILSDLKKTELSTTELSDDLSGLDMETQQILEDTDTILDKLGREEGLGDLAAPLTEAPAEAAEIADVSDISDITSMEISDLAEDLSLSEPEEEGMAADVSFDIESLGAVETESIGSPELIGEHEGLEELGGDYLDSTAGAVPAELSSEDLNADKDLEINLTDDERKQIVISLTSLPREAEIKIAKAIISGKYSNKKIKPLIDALIDNESPNIIIKYYEKITGDKSLSHIQIAKFTGVQFEKKQKSFAYFFQKNVLPVLSIIASIAFVVVFLILIFVRIIWPTYQASKNYRLGRESIDKKMYQESQNYFETAFNIQPRFKEVLKYARKYKTNKRYLETEKKYRLALNMKPDQETLRLEYAGFLTDIDDFERAEKIYKNLLANDDKNIPVLLGLADNYSEWSKEELEKLENAKETYLDILDINSKNQSAVFGKLKLHLREKNNKEIIKHYNYINKHFENKADPWLFADLAKYFIDINKLTNVKDILKKAEESVNKNEFIPDIDYQYARYKGKLHIFNEQKIHLENALKKFEYIKKTDPARYEAPTNQNLLSNIYNDMGEYYDRLSKANTEAEKYYLQAIQADNNNGKPYYNLANFALKYKPDGYTEAKHNYLEAEKKGFTNDTLTYNLGWLYYKDDDHMNSYTRINSILEKQPDNTNLKFMTGTIFYKMKKYDLSESMLLETYSHLQDLTEQYAPLEPEVKEDYYIMQMKKKVSNNLGAAYQKKYETSNKSKNLIQSTKYYSDSINLFDSLISYDEMANTASSKFKRENAHINLRMVLYPDAGLDDPVLYEDFPLDFMSYL